MHSLLTFHSYLKPTTLLQVPKMYNEVQNLGIFSIGLDVIQLIFHQIYTTTTKPPPPQSKETGTILFIKAFQ